jgi:hypothetical protein
MQVNAGWFKRGRKFLKGAGPYLLLEMLLPGGTLLALLLWLSSGSSRGQPAEVQRRAMDPAAIERIVSVGRVAAIRAARAAP